ncbi:MAG: transporter [Candidatus Sedimenticola endophacoides]|uniref:Transporter n=1 Tax=Candidatus Sedimenticola endophacoides TaxID=2548426 RepID=A0A6N4DUX3_9GAMM|nr:MAG: transporter [Candidatus Sedimenticola endophacoides]PUE00658.1 MAG: transporter [Candidatus Sedimenticola endophacoides]PUE02096.1 MAG: transporter [Candidatus Sedimenticola endophacoides]PUE05088.1 MAG: transporter [Candidatus Sedimenticola endophacoides]
MIAFINDLYRRLTIENGLLLWLLMALFIGASLYLARDFKLDASADSLVLEGDQDLRYYRGVRARYGSDDFLFVTYTPREDLFSDAVLADLKALRDELAALERVKAVTSLLDVPLIESPPITFSDLSQELRTLEAGNVDREMARNELRTSPLYSELLLSRDGTTTALKVDLKRDERYISLLEARERLRELELRRPLEGDEAAELERVSREFREHNTRLQAQMQEDIARVRAILDGHRGAAEIHLGGVPMISADMVDFVDRDIQVFGAGVGLLLILLLAFFFKQPRWILVPMLVCAAVVIAMVGFIGLMDWRVTVVSSNFISLLLVITLSLTVHLIVRHQEYHAESDAPDQRRMLADTMRTKFAPSVYTSLTTMVAFGSFVVSDIRPVIDFGWMMVVGVALAFMMAFLLFPMILSRLRPGEAVLRRHDPTAAITHSLASLIQRHSTGTLLLYGLLLALGVAGITRLSVENRFIDYFKESTEISKGMLLIDRQLGGTTPLDVVLEPNKDFLDYLREEARYAEQQGGGAPPFGDEQESGLSGDSYWFNVFELETVGRVHNYLDQLPETGKVLSLATTMRMLTRLNQDQPLDNLTLAVMHKRLPQEVKASLFDPYLAADGNQVRFSIRVIDSDVNLQRDALLKKIRADLVDELGLEPEQVKLSGMLVLYNNVLQSLFGSQILTLVVVFLAISLMLFLLFRSLSLALIGIVPTVVAAGLILGLMGWLGIPLDIMTITIAAITIGIGVDNTIHYIHRMRDEIGRDSDYWTAVRRSHASVGRAIYYTSITVTLGFSILVLSNFIPSIHFGLLTGFAMIVALVANLTLLPLLLVRFRPFGRGG